MDLVAWAASRMVDALKAVADKRKALIDAGRHPGALGGLERRAAVGRPGDHDGLLLPRRPERRPPVGRGAGAFRRPPLLQVQPGAVLSQLRGAGRTPYRPARRGGPARSASSRRAATGCGGSSAQRGAGAPPSRMTPGAAEFLDVLKSYYLFEKESPDYSLARGMLERAGLDGATDLFPILVQAGCVRGGREHRAAAAGGPGGVPGRGAGTGRRSWSAAAPARSRPTAAGVDLTDLNLFTIDGQSTLDFDDALSLEAIAGRIPARDPHRRMSPTTCARAGRWTRRPSGAAAPSTWPTRRFRMLPPGLAEGLCSLKAGEIRPAISTLVDLDPGAGHPEAAVCLPSRVRVQRPAARYFDVNLAGGPGPARDPAAAQHRTQVPR
ncbi:MAG: RNB domain-containing ribonuclease [Desulfobacterales bacterium]|nr:RNB domain-containing ribonuclease [Desulfobacterales bacterium]